MSIAGVETATKNFDRAGVKNSGTILCVAEKNPISEISHAEAGPLQGFCLIVAAFNHSASGTVVAGQEGVFPEKPFTTFATVTALAEAQERISRQRRRLHSIVMYTVRERTTGGTTVFCPG